MMVVPFGAVRASRSMAANDRFIAVVPDANNHYRAAGAESRPAGRLVGRWRKWVAAIAADATSAFIKRPDRRGN